MRRSDQFGQTVRTGVRTGKSTMVVHMSYNQDSVNAPLVGFVVSKAIGNAVTRNLVKRRLRALSRDVLPSFPGGTQVVVRALPRASTSSFEQMKHEFVACIARNHKLLGQTTSA